MDSSSEIERPSVMIAGISGSLRHGSYTRMALDVAMRGAAELGATTKLLDLREYSLPFCDGESEEEDYPEGVAKLRHDVKEADGLLLATPEYHGSFSGVLKNALDLLSFDELEGKMIGLIGVAAGSMGGFSALEGLRNVGRAVHAWVVPELAAIPQVYKAFDPSGRVKDPDLEKRLKKVGRQVARFAYLHRSDHSREFMEAWEAAFPNPGA
jgi:FMN reductase